MTVPFFELTISGNPLPKQRPRVVRGGQSYTPKATREAENAITFTARLQRSQTDLYCIEEPIRVDLDFYRGNARRVDVDNLAKLVLDALNGEVWADDSQIVELRVTKRVDRDDPRTVVRVWPAGLPGEVAA